MKLNRLHIIKFKNLEEIEINFEYPYTVIVCQNGSGKSNIYEALVTIFDSLECQRVAPFKYELEYDCRDWHIRIDSDPDREKQKTLFFVEAPGLDNTDRPLTPGHFHKERSVYGLRLIPYFVYVCIMAFLALIPGLLLNVPVV